MNLPGDQPLCTSALVVLLTGATASAQDTPVTIRAGRLLDDITTVRNVVFVMKGGVVYKNLSR